MTQGQLVKAFFFSSFAFLLYHLLKLFSPYWAPIAASMVLALLFYPLQAWMRRRVASGPGLAATLSTLAVFLVIVIPLVLAAWGLAHEARQMYPSVESWVRRQTAAPLDPAEGPPAPLARLWEKVRLRASEWGLDADAAALHTAAELRARLTELGPALVKNLFHVLLGLFVLIFSLFFFFRDGERYFAALRDVIPMDEDHKAHLTERLRTTVTAVVRGVLLTAGTQGVLAGIGFALVGVPFPLLLGVGTAFMALLPIGGAAAVWLPVMLVKFGQGATGQGIFLLAWGTLVVSLVDNFLKPLLIGSQAKIPTLLLFFGILGGLQSYGFFGVLLGPLLITLVLAFVTIYKEEYAYPAVPAPAEPPAPAAPPGRPSTRRRPRAR